VKTAPDRWQPMRLAARWQREPHSIGEAPSTQRLLQCWRHTTHGGADEPRPKERGLAMATAAPAQLDAPRRDIKALLARHPLVFYFIIAYAFSWLAWMPLVLSEDGAGILSYRSPIGFYATLAIASFVGPSLSAFIMTSITEGRIGIGRFTAPAGAVAGGASVVPVRPHRPPRDHGAQRDLPAGGPGIVSRARWPGPAAHARSLCLRICPRRTTGRRAWVARICAAPPAAAVWSLGREPDPRAHLGILAPVRRQSIVDHIGA
jgi:hypothetical protein